MEEKKDKSLKGLDADTAGGNVPDGAAGPVTPPPSQADIIAFFQQRVTELEKRLYETQEKALMFSIELKSREETQKNSGRQAAELFEKFRETQKLTEQERRMSERLAQLEQICKRLEACEGWAGWRGGSAGAHPGGVPPWNAAPQYPPPGALPAPPSAAPSAEGGGRNIPEQAVPPGTPAFLPYAAGEGLAEIASMRDALALLPGRIALLEARLSEERAAGGASSPAAEANLKELASMREAVALLSDRIAMVESRLSVVTASLSEAAAKIGLREKLNSNDFSALRERIEKLEKNDKPGKSEVPPEYQAQLENRFSAFEAELARIREAEAPLSEAAKKIDDLEIGVRNASRDRATAAENRQVIVAAIEDLRLKFNNMSVLFEQIRMWMVSHRKK